MDVLKNAANAHRHTPTYHNTPSSVNYHSLHCFTLGLKSTIPSYEFSKHVEHFGEMIKQNIVFDRRDSDHVFDRAYLYHTWCKQLVSVFLTLDVYLLHA